jgi:hypothetical protein
MGQDGDRDTYLTSLPDGSYEQPVDNEKPPTI